MADKRAYFKMDVGYMSNPKVLGVLDESSSAILLHIASIAYATQHLTDGVVPVKALLRMTGASEADAELLVAAGLWVEGPTGGRAEVHDYLQHQRSASEVKGASEKAKRAADAKWAKNPDASRNASGNAVSNASSMQDAMPNASEIAMPREKEREREREDQDPDAFAPEPPSTSLALVAEHRPDVDRICETFADYREDMGSKRPTVTSGWRKSARLMLDNDGRTEVEVMSCLRWLFASTHRDARFWRVNVRSMPKLREEYDRLRELATQAPAVGGRAAEQSALLDRAMARAEARERSGA